MRLLPVESEVSFVDGDTPRRELPVSPTVHAESFATHYTLTWKASPLSRFLTAARDCAAVPASASAVVDATDVAGRRRVDTSVLTADAAVRYVRVEPPAGWTLSWERRTSPTVSVSGTPDAAVCRELHRRTTACDRWPPAAVDALDALVESTE